MARILFVVPRFHTNLFFATKALVEAGHEVTVFAASEARLEDHSVVQPVVLGEAPGREEVQRMLADLSPDLVLLRQTRGLSQIVYSAARALGLNIRGYDLRPLTQRRGLRKRLSYWSQGRPWQRVTPVPGLNPDASPDLSAHYLPWPTEAADLPPGAFRDPEADPVHVLCVGKLAQVRKNQHLLIAALEPLAGQITLTLAGATDRGVSGADDAHLAALEAAEAWYDWITILRDVPFAEMPALYARHHVCVLPSEGEPLGIAPVEGMAYGTIPVIAQDAGSAGYLTPGRDGIRVDMTEVGALARALADLVAHPELRLRLSEGARQTVRSELSPARFVTRLESLLR